MYIVYVYVYICVQDISVQIEYIFYQCVTCIQHKRKEKKTIKTKQNKTIYKHIKHRTNFLVRVVGIQTTVTVCGRCFVFVVCVELHLTPNYSRCWLLQFFVSC